MGRMTIGEAMRACRKQVGLSTVKVEILTGLHHNSISNYENNRHFPSLMTLLQLADTYGVTLDELVGREWCLDITEIRRGSEEYDGTEEYRAGEREEESGFILGGTAPKEIYKRALNTYGAEAQTRMCFEEMAELQKELCKNARGADNKEAIAEEIADVLVTLDQMAILHDCIDEIQKFRISKTSRLKRRLEQEK